MDIAFLLQRESATPLKQPYPHYANLELARKARNSRASRSYSRSSRAVRSTYSPSPFLTRLKIEEEDKPAKEYLMLTIEESDNQEKQLSQSPTNNPKRELEEELKTVSIEADASKNGPRPASSALLRQLRQAPLTVEESILVSSAYSEFITAIPSITPTRAQKILLRNPQFVED